MALGSALSSEPSLWLASPLLTCSLSKLALSWACRPGPALGTKEHCFSCHCKPRSKWCQADRLKNHRKLVTILLKISRPLPLSHEILVLVTQSCPTHCEPMDCNPLGSSVQGIFQTGVGCHFLLQYPRLLQKKLTSVSISFLTPLSRNTSPAMFLRLWSVFTFTSLYSWDSLRLVCECKGACEFKHLHVCGMCVYVWVCMV